MSIKESIKDISNKSGVADLTAGSFGANGFRVYIPSTPERAAERYYCMLAMEETSVTFENQTGKESSQIEMTQMFQNNGAGNLQAIDFMGSPDATFRPQVGDTIEFNGTVYTIQVVGDGGYVYIGDDGGALSFQEMGIVQYSQVTYTGDNLQNSFVIPAGMQICGVFNIKSVISGRLLAYLL